jgi:hypothetical protein
MKKESTKARRRREMKLQPFGRGIFAVLRKQRPLRLETRDLPMLRQMLGDNLLVGFVQGFNAAERIDSYMHLLEMNWEVAKKDSVAQVRNLRTIVFAMFGMLYEAMDAIESLHRAGMNGMVEQSFLPWKRLQEMRVRWEKDPMLKRMRHGLGHHLGDDEEIRAGLSRIKPGKRIAVFETDGGSMRMDSAYPIALEVLMRGMNIEDKDFSAFASRAREDQSDLGLCLQTLFAELLRRKSVRFGELDEADFGGSPDGSVGA